MSTSAEPGYLGHLARVSDAATWRRKLDYLRHNFGADVGPGQAVLEVGPGRGEFLAFAAERGVRHVDVVDADPQIAERVRGNPLVRRAWCARAEALEVLEDELDRYDVVFLLHVLEHVEKSAVVPLVRRLYDRLAPGGRLLATVPNGANPLSVVERYSDFTHQCLFTQESLAQVVDLCGLSGAAVAVRGYRIPPVDLLNRARVVAQWSLHRLLQLALVANGGVHFSLFHPNITLVLTRGAAADAPRSAVLDSNAHS